MNTYYPEISWSTIVKNPLPYYTGGVFQLNEYTIEVYPLDVNEPGASTLNCSIDDYVIDYLGYPWQIKEITTISQGLKLRLLDVNARSISEYINYAPYPNRIGYVYRPLNNQVLLSQAQLYKLDNQARDRINNFEKGILGTGSSGEGGKAGPIYSFDNSIDDSAPNENYVKFPEVLIPSNIGYLYNVYATEHPLFAPTNWKVPESSDYDELVAFLGGTNIAGGKLKALTNWNEPNIDATNETDFSAFAAGKRDEYDSFGFFGEQGYFMEKYGDNGLHLIRVDGVAYQNTEFSGGSVRLLYTGQLPAPSSITDIDGNIYDVIQIGNQYWTKQNWACKRLLNLQLIHNLQSDLDWNEAKGDVEDTFGYFYNYYAVSNVDFAPTDWGVPTAAEFSVLENYVAGIVGGINVGDALKSTDTTFWSSTSGHTDAFGFSIVGTGNRLSGFIALARKETCSIWTLGYGGALPSFGLNQSFITYDPVSDDDGHVVRLLYKGAGTPGSIVTDYDGNTYDVVQIGTQYWLKQDWRCTKLNSGVPIENLIYNADWASSVTPAYCIYDNQTRAAYCAYNNDETIVEGINELNMFVSKKMLSISFDNFLTEIKSGYELILYQIDDESKFKRLNIDGDISDEGTYFKFPITILEESTTSIDLDGECSLIISNNGTGVTDDKVALVAPITATIAAGGIQVGDEFTDEQSVRDLFSALIAPYVAPVLGSIVINPGSTVEVGATISIVNATLSWTNGSDNDVPINASITGPGFGGVTLTSSPQVISATGGTTVQKTVNTNQSWIFSGQDKDSNNLTTKVDYVYWYYRRFFGGSSISVIDDATAQTVIDALQVGVLDANRAAIQNCDTYNSNASNFTYIAYAASFGSLSSVLLNGALDVLGAFTELGNFNFVNAEGLTVSYKIYKSNATGAFQATDVLTIN